MPLIKSAKKSDVSKNIRLEKSAHPDMPQRQAVAIALSVQRQAKRKKHGSS